jgi:hypothetical protein
MTSASSAEDGNDGVIESDYLSAASTRFCLHHHLRLLFHTTIIASSNSDSNSENRNGNSKSDECGVTKKQKHNKRYNQSVNQSIRWSVVGRQKKRYRYRDRR